MMARKMRLEEMGREVIQYLISASTSTGAIPHLLSVLLHVPMLLRIPVWNRFGVLTANLFSDESTTCKLRMNACAVNSTRPFVLASAEPDPSPKAILNPIPRNPAVSSARITAPRPTASRPPPNRSMVSMKRRCPTSALTAAAPSTKPTSPRKSRWKFRANRSIASSTSMSVSAVSATAGFKDAIPCKLLTLSALPPPKL